ncbi:unnamed protein product [Porites evermanni]|uniref:Uncharacterized protein n=1 Tax=Porites evermanni TaxID=104178 RepID=A0ABN8SBV1_9CNID|nr:unnamed protein product [Porites evermanni]
MEWKEVTSFFVVLLCRFILFLFIIVLSLLILGIPNVNTCFLTVFMAFIIPLPPNSILVDPIHCMLSKFSQALRAYTAYAVVLTEVQRVTFITIPHYLLSVVSHGRLECILRYFVHHIRFTIPQMASKITATLVALMLPYLRLLGKIIRMILAGLWKASGMFFVVGIAALCAPGLEPLPNLLLTGHLYPGSLIRFQRCAKYEDSTACHSSFLEFSYTVWNLTRTGLFVVMCWTLDCHAWIPPRRDFTSIVERCLALHNKTYSQLLLCAAGLPLLMNGHCLSQTVHNILCTASLLLFMVTLNGYHSRTALMTYCALCCVAMNVQSLLVAVFNIYRNLQTQKNGYMATLLYIMQLYLTFLVIMDSCTRVMSKVKNPKQDILGEDG